MTSNSHHHPAIATLSVSNVPHSESTIQSVPRHRVVLAYWKIAMSLLDDLHRTTTDVHRLQQVSTAIAHLERTERASDVYAAAAALVQALQTADVAALRAILSGLYVALSLRGQWWKWDLVSNACDAYQHTPLRAAREWMLQRRQNMRWANWTRISPTTNAATLAALDNSRPAPDPLVIDLDGGGILVNAINRQRPVLFDFSGNGVRAGTGWIGSGEAFVVRDLNGNGQIDSGLELFGDQTRLTRGPNAGQIAAHGFAALADLDTNGDGQFDVREAQRYGVRLWRDANQDGVSQSSELLRFADAHIGSISLRGQPINTDLGNGNTATMRGTFNPDNTPWSPRQPARFSGVAVNLTLASNRFYRQFSDDPATTAAAQALPTLRGSGQVRDLRTAMSLGSAEAGQLQTLMRQYVQANSRSQQQAALDAVVHCWGQTSTLMTSIQTDRSLARTAAGPGTRSAVAQFAQDQPERYLQITALEQFNGFTLLDQWVVATATGHAVRTNQRQRSWLRRAYQALRSSVYSGLLLQTRLKPYLDRLRLRPGAAGGLQLRAGDLLAFLELRRSNNPHNALIDLIELDDFLGPLHAPVAAAVHDRLLNWLRQIAPDTALDTELQSLGFYRGSASGGSGNADIYVGNQDANTFHAAAGDDDLHGAGGDDQLDGGDGNDTLDGGAGNDHLIGGAGTNHYLFGRNDGHDTIGGIATPGQSTHGILQFKTSVLPSHIQISRDGIVLTLGIRDTSDQVSIQTFFDAGDQVRAYTPVREVRFHDDPATIWDVSALRRMALDALPAQRPSPLTGTSVASALTRPDEANVARPTPEQNATNSTSQHGTSGDDTLHGGDGENILYGEAGDDQLFGHDGNDQLYGETGADLLEGGTGNDRLSGGTGHDWIKGDAGDDWIDGGPDNDTMNGGAGNDTYLFKSNAGQDSITDLDYNDANIDTIHCDNGIELHHLWLTKIDNALQLQRLGEAGFMRINNWYLGSIFHIERIVTADNTTLQPTEVERLVEAMASVGVPPGGINRWRYGAPQGGQLTIVAGAAS